MDTIEIRPITPNDHAQWLPLWLGYNAFYGREGATALAPEITATTWARLLDPAVPMHAFVAEHEGALVGLTHIVLHHSTIQVESNCYLQDLFVSPAVRGRGVAKALIEAVYDFARQARLPRVYWQTHETNAVARKLYDTVAERSGFIVYRRIL
ncbi:N-acetyltransferase family protein [Lysobacter sp. 2RAF19]